MCPELNLIGSLFCLYTSGLLLTGFLPVYQYTPFLCVKNYTQKLYRIGSFLVYTQQRIIVLFVQDYILMGFLLIYQNMPALCLGISSIQFSPLTDWLVRGT